MARKNQVQTIRTKTSLTAAGTRIDLTNPVYGEKREVSQKWQKRVWELYDEVGEVAFAANFMGDAFSKLRLYVGTYIDNNLVELVADNLPVEAAGLGINPQNVTQATEVLNALGNPLGMSEVQRTIGIGLFLPGEHYLLGSENEFGEEEWQTISTEQLMVDAQQNYKIKRNPGDTTGKEISEEDFLLRLWRRDSRWPNYAYSANKSALILLEELLLKTLEIRAATQSRIPAGIVAISSAISRVKNDPFEEETGDDEESLLQQMLKHFTTAIKEPGDASAVVPFLLEADVEDISKAITKIDIGREIPKESIELRSELINRYASAINLPNEIVTGKAGLNHWNAWNIDENKIDDHIGPAAQVMCDGITMGYLLPRLSVEGQETPPFVIGFDPTDLIGVKDETETIQWAYEQNLIDDKSTRARLKISEAEAEDIVKEEPAQQTPIPDPSNQPPEEPDSQTSSATPVFDMGQAERELRNRLLIAADAAMHRALERAGAKLRSAAQKDRAAKQQIAASGISNEDLISVFPSFVSTFNQTDDGLLEKAFDAYLDQWERDVTTAQESVLDMAFGLTAALDDTERAAMAALFASQREQARRALSNDLYTQARQRLYDPSPDAEGEVDPNLLVSPGYIRSSLALAGGSSEIGFGVGGFFTAALVLSLFDRSQHLGPMSAFSWDYGNPLTRPRGSFEPHARLGGQTFSSWNDPRLQVSGGFPKTAFYHPGDHRGCQCDISYTIRMKGE